MRLSALYCVLSYGVFLSCVVVVECFVRVIRSRFIVNVSSGVFVCVRFYDCACLNLSMFVCFVCDLLCGVVWFVVLCFVCLFVCACVFNGLCCVCELYTVIVLCVSYDLYACGCLYVCALCS